MIQTYVHTEPDHAHIHLILLISVPKGSTMFLQCQDRGVLCIISNHNWLCHNCPLLAEKKIFFFSKHSMERLILRPMGNSKELSGDPKLITQLLKMSTHNPKTAIIQA